MGTKDISKVDFFRQFQQFYNRTLSTKLCYSAFTKTGLIPLNPDIVIVELLKYQTNQGTAEPVLESESKSESEGFATPPPTTPPPSNWMEWPTPLSLRTRQKGVDYIQDRQSKAIMEETPLTPSVLRIQKKVEKASITSILKGGLSTHRLHDLQNAEAQCNKNKGKDGNKVVQKYGEIYGHQARRQIKEDRLEEDRVINLRNQRMGKIWRKKYTTMVSTLFHEYCKTGLRSIGHTLWEKDPNFMYFD